jgi:hypothetical protein
MALIAPGHLLGAGPLSADPDREQAGGGGEADLAGTDTRMFRLGGHQIRIGAANIPGRHFFMHPRDTYGVLMEWTDDTFGPNGGGDGSGDEIGVENLASVTAAVSDAEATATFLAELAGATRVAPPRTRRAPSAFRWSGRPERRPVYVGGPAGRARAAVTGR